MKRKRRRVKKSDEIYYHEIFFKVLKRYFKNIHSWTEELDDFRMELKCTYPLKYMCFAGILFFVLKLQKRRQWYKLRSKQLIKNLNKYLGFDLNTVLHYDTLNYFCKGFENENLEKLRYKIIQSLFRGKVLTKNRIFNKYYLLAIDGTKNLTFKKNTQNV